MSRPPTQTRRAHELDLDNFRTAVKRARTNTKRSKERSEEIVTILDRLVWLYTEEQHGTTGAGNGAPKVTPSKIVPSNGAPSKGAALKGKGRAA